MGTKIIDEIKDFWNQNPLFEGESKYPAGSSKFFEDHKEVYMNDVFAGTINNYGFFSQIKPNTRVLDLGCGLGFSGRGRENIYLNESTKQIVRLYDGEDNPKGVAYSKKEMMRIIENKFVVEQSFLYYSPTRIFPFKVPRFIHRFLAKHFGFMIAFSLRKK